MISAQMRDVLFAHLDGAVVRIPDPGECSGQKAKTAEADRRTTEALIARNLLRKTSKPRHTVLTESGRVELAKLLAEYAEVLLRAARHVEELRYIAGLPERVPAESRKIPELLMPLPSRP